VAFMLLASEQKTTLTLPHYKEKYKFLVSHLITDVAQQQQPKVKHHNLDLLMRDPSLFKF